MPSTNHPHSHSHTHSHADTHSKTSTHKPPASHKSTSPPKSHTPPQKQGQSQSQPQPLPPQTTSKSQHENNITDILPRTSIPTLPPPATEATLCASIRLQSRLSDLLETARLFVEFDEGTKNSETYHDLTYFYHRELKHSLLSVLRAQHHLTDRIAEGLDPSSSPSPSPSSSSQDPSDARKAREAALLALVPKALRETCGEVEREIGEVRARRKGGEWKGLGRGGRRNAWRGYCERLVGVVEGGRGAREREVEGLRGEVRGEVRKLVGGL